MLPSFLLTFQGWSKLFNEITGMTSRTPIRLTPHRGPLATPSTSPESSPTASTPPSDISYRSASPGLDIDFLQDRISALNPPTQYQCQPRLWGLFGRDTQLRLAFEGLMNSACSVAKAVPGIVTLCLLTWAVLEWHSYASGLLGQADLRLSASRFPLPSRSRTFPLHGDPSLYEPEDQHAAVLQFIVEQIRHARALSSLSVDFGSPLRAFFEAHRTSIPSVEVRRDLCELPHLQEVDPLANLTESLDSSLLDFTHGSFIGRTFSLALDELGGLISDSMLSQRSSLRGGYPDARLEAIYWRTTSNLLLEYSAARPRARKLLQYLRDVHRQLSPIALGQLAAESIAESSDVVWWEGIFRHPTSTIDDRMQTFVTGLEVTIDNLQRLTAYLDWITDHLVQTTLKDVWKKHPTTNFWSCLTSLQELFVQSRPPTPRKFCFCWTDEGVPSPRKVDIMVPGTPTVRAGR